MLRCAAGWDVGFGRRLLDKENDARLCVGGLMVGSDRAMCGSEFIDERLVDEGLPCIPTLVVIGIAGRVARRASCMSLRAAFI